MVAVVQLVRASDCGSECRGFESHLPPIRSSSSELLFLFLPISQAQPTHSPRTAEHIPRTTNIIPRTAEHIPHAAEPIPFTSKPLLRPTAIVPARRGSSPPRLEHIPAKLEGTLAKLEGTSTQLLTTSGDAHRTIRAFVSSETRIRTVRYVHPRRPIRASNDGHHTAEHTHNQCLADR